MKQVLHASPMSFVYMVTLWRVVLGCDLDLCLVETFTLSVPVPYQGRRHGARIGREPFEVDSFHVTPIGIT